MHVSVYKRMWRVWVCLCVSDLQGDLLLGHGPLHSLVHLSVLDAQAAEDGEGLQELLLVPVEAPQTT